MCSYHRKIIFSLLFIMLIFSAGCSRLQDQGRSPAAVEPTPTLVIVGSTMEKPVPFGYDIMLQEFVLRIDEIIRSEHTTLTNQEGESILEEGQEFLLIRLTNQCVKPGQNKCHIGPLDYQIYDSTGHAILPENDLTGLEELLADSEISSGASLKGMLAFRVEKDEIYSILSYVEIDGSPVFFSLAY